MTWGKPLRGATVGEVFDNSKITTFREIEGTGNVNPYTDVSLLQERRVLYYFTTNGKLFAFNVDDRTNTEIDVGGKVLSVTSFTGIDCGVKIVFKSNDDNCTYTLNMDDTVTLVAEKQEYPLAALLPSTSNPKSVRDAVLMYGWNIVKDGRKIDTTHLIRFDWYSMVRVYKDIFLVYDKGTKSWVLIRILVP